jgi:flagellar biosynthetic protein FliR
VSLDLPAETLVAYLLALVRASAWIAVVPPFGTRSIPTTVKVALAAALAFAVTPDLTASTPPLETASLIGAITIQAAVGLCLGLVTLILFSAVRTAGDLIDTFGGLALTSAYDPLSMQQNSVFGRFYNLIAVTLLFATNAHLVLVHGLLASYKAVPASTTQPLEALSRLVIADVGTFFIAALQIAGPLLAVIVLTDVGLGLLTKAAPTLNVFSLGFPLKIFVTMTLIGTMFLALPGAVGSLMEKITRSNNVVASVVNSGQGRDQTGTGP